MRDASFSSVYWSATTYPNTADAYDLHFDNTSIYPSYYTYRYYGFLVSYLQNPTLTTLLANPIYYVRGGGILLNTGSLRYTGYASLYWSTTIYPNTTDAYNLHFNNTNIVPSDYSNRFHGFSVRGGVVHLNTGSLRYAGLDSYYWSATIYPSTTNAYYLDFHSSNVYSSRYTTRYLGFSMRFYAAGTLI